MKRLGWSEPVLKRYRSATARQTRWLFLDFHNIVLKVTQYQNKKLNEMLSDSKEILLLPCKERTKHTDGNSCYRQTFQAPSLSSSQTTSRDAKPTQYIETTHPDNVNLKLAFHKVASFHPHYLTYTLKTYQHPVHRFRSWPTQMTSPSHPHTQARVQPRNIYNHTYIKNFPGQNKTISY